MTAERIDYHQQQLFQGDDVERLQYPLTKGSTLGRIEVPTHDHFSLPNHSYRTISQTEAAAMEQDRTDIIEDAIRGRTIDLGSTAVASIFVFNHDKQTEAPELA